MWTGQSRNWLKACRRWGNATAHLAPEHNVVHHLPHDFVTIARDGLINITKDTTLLLVTWPLIACKEGERERGREKERERKRKGERGRGRERERGGSFWRLWFADLFVYWFIFILPFTTQSQGD